MTNTAKRYREKEDCNAMMDGVFQYLGRLDNRIWAVLILQVTILLAVLAVLVKR